MARTFNGTSDKIVLSGGALPAAWFGTVAAIIRPVSSSNAFNIFGIGNSSNRMNFRTQSGGALRIQLNASTSDSTTLVTVGAWWLVACTKTSGTTTPRFHFYRFDTGAFTHENGGSSLANSSSMASAANIGTNEDASIFWNGDIAVLGNWTAVLTDAQVELLPFNLPSWFAAGQPNGLWVLDQDSVSQAVPDLSGGGANQSSISGTSVSSNSVPIWTPHGEVIVIGGQVNPGNTVAPAVTGTTTVGQTLSTTDGSWTNSPSSYTYQWQRDALGNGVYSNIGGATSNTYTLVDADDTCHVRCVVTATNGSGSGVANSNAVGPVVEPAPTNSVAPDASGTATLGSTVTTTTGTWTHMAGASGVFSYQWQRDNYGSGGYVNISGQTSASMVVPDEAEQCHIRCVVTGTNDGGAASANSDVLGPVNAPLPVNVTDPFIVGDVAVGNEISCNVGAWSYMGGHAAVFTFQWQRSVDGGANYSNIGGETAQTYTVMQADHGYLIRCKVTATNSAG